MRTVPLLHGRGLYHVKLQVLPGSAQGGLEAMNELALVLGIIAVTVGFFSLGVILGGKAK